MGQLSNTFGNNRFKLLTHKHRGHETILSIPSLSNTNTNTTDITLSPAAVHKGN